MSTACKFGKKKLNLSGASFFYSNMACIGHIKVNCEWGSIFITPTVQCLIIPCNQCMSAGLWGLDWALCTSFQEWGTKKSFSNKSNWLVRKGFLVNQCISFSLHWIDHHQMLLCLPNINPDSMSGSPYWNSLVEIWLPSKVKTFLSLD